MPATGKQDQATLAAIGECMLELHPAVDGRGYELSYGGDAINTAVYAARLGARSSFFTALGDGHYSQWLLARWQEEGVGCAAVRVLPGLEPSLYIIRNDAAGERNFHYWRQGSPFKQWLAEGGYRDGLASQLARHRLALFTGIGLAMLPAAARPWLLELLQGYQASGGLLAFDPNYRARLWESPALARRWMERGLAIADFALPSMEDLELLGMAGSPEDAFRQTSRLGKAELVLKLSAAGCLARVDGQPQLFRIDQPAAAVDATAAGDSFNAGYLVSRLLGRAVPAAVRQAQTLAAQVVQHPGAIIPRD